MEMAQQARAKFMEAVRHAEPQRCMVDLEGPCNAEPVRAHFIQESLLRHLAGSKGKKMHSLYSYHSMAFADKRLYTDQLLTREVSSKSAASLPFICKNHEQLFWEVEGKGFVFENPRHTTLLAYRTLLAESYIKEWFRQAGLLDGQHQVVASQEDYLRFFTPLKNIV